MTAQLKDATREIRLLSILPGERDDDIECTLQVVPLSRDTGYEALSYAWDDSQATIPITLQGQGFQVTSNLHSALVELRRRLKPRVLWVDAVCIDQNNIVELGSQVQNMRKIYQYARQVLVWLGAARENSDLIMDKLEELSAVKDSDIIQQTLHKLSTIEENAAWEALFQRTWWTRTWVVQEFVVAAAEPVFGCGDRWVGSSVLDRMYKQAEGNQDLALSRLLFGESRIAAFTLFGYRRVFLNNGHCGSLANLLIGGRDTRQTKPHDAVYAMLGIAVPGSTSGIFIDYDKSVEQVYTEVAIRLLSSSRDISLLYHAPGTRQLQLPSWVPDFSVPADSRTFFLSSYRASGNLESCVQFSSDASLMKVEGYEIDFLVEHAESDSAERNVIDKARYIGKFIQQWQDYGLTDPRRHLWRTLIGDHPFRAYSHCPAPAEYSQKYEALFENGPIPSDFGPELTSSVRWWEFIKPYALAMDATLAGRSIFVTRKGRLGIGPRNVQKGDLVCVLFGGDVPFILREVDSGERLNMLIGDAYVQGLMYGEAVHDRSLGSKRWFFLV